MGCTPLNNDGRDAGTGGGGSGGRNNPVAYNDPCSPNPCVFGTCSLIGNGFQCACQAGYAGKRLYLISGDSCTMFNWIS